MRGSFCPLQRCSIRKLQIQIHVTLIFVRKKARGQLGAEEPRKDSADKEEDKRESALADESTGNPYIAVRCTRKDPVEPIKKSPQETAAFLARLQQQCRKCRAQSQRVKGGEYHGDCDGHRELLVESPGDSWNKCGRNKYCGNHQRDPHHRS